MHGLQCNTKTYELPSELNVSAQQKVLESKVLESEVNHSSRSVAVSQSLPPTHPPAYCEHDFAAPPPYKESIGQHEQDVKSAEKPTSQVPVLIKVPDSNIAYHKPLHQRICDKYVVPAVIIYLIVAAALGCYFMVKVFETDNS